MTKSIYIYITLLILGISFQSCADDVLGGMESIPTAFGKVNEVTVLSDQMMWDGPVGDTLDFYYTGAFPVTPTPEPLLDLRHFNHDQITHSTVFKHYRNYIILANLGDRESKMTQMVVQDIGQEKYRQAMKDPSFNSIVGKNKWAKGQILIYLFAPTESQLMDVIKAKLPDILQRVYAHDYEQIKANTYSAGENVIAKNALKEIANLDAEIPSEFALAKKSLNDRMIWLRKDDNQSIQSVVVRTIPYESDSQFGKEEIIGLVEDFGSKHIEGDKLLVNDRDLPTYEFVKSTEDRYSKELRGIWETEKSYMGGPYIAYLIKEKDSNQLIFTMSFIYAAGSPKRNLLQRMEVIMNSIKGMQETN